MIITLLIMAYSPMDGVSRRVTTFCRARNVTTNSLYVVVGAVLMALGSAALISDSIVSASLLNFLQGLTIPISLASKVPQILELHRSKAPGELSIIVVFAQLMGTLARVFTTLTETNDQLLFWGFALATVFNLVIAVQVVLYWNGNQKRAAQLHERRWFDSPNATPTSLRMAELPLVTPRPPATDAKRD